MSGFSNSLTTTQFGIESLVPKGAKIFYENIFSLKHIGRLIDFVLYESTPFFEKTKNREFLEYRARQIFELTLFLLWGNFSKSQKTKWIELEFSFDHTRFILALAGQSSQGLVMNFKDSGLVKKIQTFSDGVAIRFNPKSERVQFLCFLKTDADIIIPEEPSLKEIQIAAVEPLSENKDDTKMPYIGTSIKPLSQANIHAFNIDSLGDKKPLPKEVSQKEASAPGQAQGDDSITLLDSNLDTGAESIALSGDTPQKDEAVTLSGTTGHHKDEMILVRGKKQEQDSHISMLSKTATLKEENESDTALQYKLSQSQNTIKTLAQKLEREHQKFLESKQKENILNSQLFKLQEQIKLLKGGKR